MKLAAIVCLSALLPGCAVIERVMPGAQRPAQSIAVNTQPAQDLVAYLAQLRGLNERGLAAEATRQRQVARSEPGDLVQLKLAMALSLSSLAEESEIISLVEPVSRKDLAPAELRAMASFLHVQALERRRLKENAATSGARARDERRAAESQKLRADGLQERATQLQQKLDALTELEKSLADRQAQGR